MRFSTTYCLLLALLLPGLGCLMAGVKTRVPPGTRPILVGPVDKLHRVENGAINESNYSVTPLTFKVKSNSKGSQCVSPIGALRLSGSQDTANSMNQPAADYLRSNSKDIIHVESFHLKVRNSAWWIILFLFYDSKETIQLEARRLAPR